VSASENPDIPTGRVSRDDIERKMREITSTVDGGTAEVKSLLPVIAAAAVAVVVVGVWLLGRKSGRKKAAFIEIRRV
jgi:hypothetical protein